MKVVNLKTVMGLLAILAAILMIAPQSVTAFDLKGKTVTFFVPFSEGGSSDTMARMLQPHLQEALPGNPTILVRNRPGGGSITGCNEFAREGKADGTELIVLSSSSMFPAALGSKRVEYDPTSWRCLMSKPRGAIFYGNAKALGIENPKDAKHVLQALRSRPVIFGAKAPTGSDLSDLSAMEMLGMEVKPVFGLGASKRRQGFLRGELTVSTSPTLTYLKMKDQFVELANAVELFSFGLMTADGSVGRDPNIPDVPTFVEFYQQATGELPSGPAFEAYKGLLYCKTGINKSIFLQKGTPDEIYNVYMAAIKEVFKKPQVMEWLEKSSGNGEVSFGDEAKAMVVGALRVTPESRTWIDTLLKTKYDSSLD